MEVILFIGGLMLGGFIGVVIMCMCQVAHDSDYNIT